MIEGRLDDIRSASNSLVWRLLDITRGPLPIDQGINLALQVIFLRWHLARSEGGLGKWIEILQDPNSTRDIIDRELASALRNAPPPMPRGNLVSKEVRAMCRVIHDALTGREERDTDILRESFEGALGLYGEQGLRGENEYMGPDSVVRLSTRLVGPQSAYVDPASGYGSTLRAACLLNPEATLVGFDVSAYALTVTEMRLRISGSTPELLEGDAFDQVRGRENLFGGVIVQPPWNMRVDTDTVARRLQLLGADIPPASLRTDIAWLELALRLMASDGRAAVFLTQSSAKPVKGQSESHRRLLDIGAVEAVIDFPQGGMAISTAVPTTLWILRKPDESTRSSDVLLVDASTLVERERRGTTLSNKAVDLLEELLEAWRTKAEVHAPAYVARKIGADQFNLQLKGMLPSLYLDEAPEEKVSLPEPPKRLISRLDLKGYKAFSEPTSVDLAPLTLVYGANSAGKSSIIQSLLLLKQSVDRDHLVTQGDWADVGNFEGVSSGHRGENIELGFEYGSLSTWIPENGTADPSELRNLRFTFSGGPTASSSIGALSVLDVSWGGHVLSLQSSADGRFYLPFDLAESVMKGIVSGRVLFPFEMNSSLTDASEEGLRNLKSRESRVRAAVRRFRAFGEDALTVRASGLLPTSEVEYSKEFRNASTDRQRSTDMSYTNRLARVMGGVSSEVRDLLDSISYLGPLRSAPKRYYDQASRSERPGDGYETAMRLYNNSVIVDEVNEWLSNLEVPYNLKMLPIEAQEGVASLVGDLVVMALTDTRSSVQVTPADVGYGVSQMLPIIVTLLAETDSIVCIEQPETHLHPRLQARLADLFIASSSVEGQGNQLIVETHSEHLMLRIQRRIREGSLAPADVAVIYVDQDESGRADVIRIRMNEDGEFLDEWPEGFFEERLDEIFGEVN